MADSGQQSNSPEDDGPPPNNTVTKKKKAMPRRRRTLSYKKYSSTNQKIMSLDCKVASQSGAAPSSASVPQVESQSAAAASHVSDSARIECHVSTRGASRYVTNADLKNNLKSTHNKLSAALNIASKKDKQIESLTKKNQELCDTVRSARQNSRQTKSTSSEEVKRLQSELMKLQATIDEKEVEILKLQQLNDSHISSGIADAIEKEKARSARLVASIESKAERNLEKCRKRHSLELADKDKEIKRLKTICDGRLAAAFDLQIEKSKLRAEHDREMLQTEAKHTKANVKSINSRHAAKQELMKESLKKTNLELAEVTEMSMHVAEECFQLKNASDAKVRHSTKQAERSDSLSKARLEKLKKSKENEAKLRESLDSTTEAFDIQLAKAHAEIGVLTELLADSNCEVDELQEALVQAREELAVSDVFLILYQLHALTPKLLPQKLKPHIVQKKKGQWDEV
eukprot:scaffold10078_cov70-Cyclotella_meneghiniana.AAC.1